MFLIVVDDHPHHDDEDGEGNLAHWLAPPGQSQRQLIVESASGNLQLGGKYIVIFMMITRTDDDDNDDDDDDDADYDDLPTYLGQSRLT